MLSKNIATSHWRKIPPYFCIYIINSPNPPPRINLIFFYTQQSGIQCACRQAGGVAPMRKTQCLPQAHILNWPSARSTCTKRSKKTNPAQPRSAFNVDSRVYFAIAPPVYYILFLYLYYFSYFQTFCILTQPPRPLTEPLRHYSTPSRLKPNKKSPWLLRNQPHHQAQAAHPIRSQVLN